MNQPKILVLGYGNPGRQDDGLGPAAAGALGQLGCQNLTVIDDYQLNIEDALDIASHDIIWFVDATKTGQAPFTVASLQPSPSMNFTTHLLRPEALLAIAQLYCRRTPPAYQLAIRGYEFAFVESLTQGARDNLAAALTMLRASITTSQQPATSQAGA